MRSANIADGLTTAACLLPGIQLTQGKSLTSILPVAHVAMERGIHSTSAWSLGSPGNHHTKEHNIARAPGAPPLEANITLADSLAQVQGILANIEKQPTCKRLAAKHLVHACGVYDGRDQARSTDEVLEMHQKHFAIRMTECELGDAKQAMPKSCAPLLANPPTVEPEVHINGCLNDLYDQGANTWTSFNAVKSNAHIMCRAVRSQQDKDEYIQFLKLLLQANRDLNTAMESHGEQADRMREQFYDIISNMKNFRGQMHQDNEDLKQAVKQSWETVQQNMTAMGSNLEGLLEMVIKTAKHMNEHVEETELALARFETIRTSSDSWSEDLAQWRVEVEEAQAQRKFQMQQELDILSTVVGQVTSSVEAANGLTSALAAEIDAIDFRLHSVMTNVQTLDEGSDILVNKQHDTLERMDDLRSKSKATLETVEATLEKVRTLKAIVETVTTVLSSIGFLLTPWMAWLCFVVLLALLLCGWSVFGSLVMSLFVTWVLSLFLQLSGSTKIFIDNVYNNALNNFPSLLVNHPESTSSWVVSGSSFAVGIAMGVAIGCAYMSYRSMKKLVSNGGSTATTVKV